MRDLRFKPHLYKKNQSMSWSNYKEKLLWCRYHKLKYNCIYIKKTYIILNNLTIY